MSHGSPPPRGEPGRRSSDVLDAIFDRVAEERAPANAATLLFRQKALEQLDVATEVDNQLPLVPRRLWLLFAGLAAAVVAFLVWATLTPSVEGVTGQGRVVAPSGVQFVTAPESGAVTASAPDAGTMVSPGTPVTTIRTDAGQAIEVRSVIAGTVWQRLGTTGSSVEQGAPLVSLLPAGSERTVLVMVPESSARQIAVGQRANINGGLLGSVQEVEAPLTPAEAQRQSGLLLTDESSNGTLYVPVVVASDTALTPGAEASVRIVLSDSSVLARLVGRS